MCVRLSHVVRCVRTVTSSRDASGSCSMTLSTATKRLSWRQLQVLDKSVAKVVTQCADDYRSRTTGGLTEKE